jgi:hypothetical protein
MAERTGIFVFTSAQTTNNALKREYKDLFLQREATQARMRVIEEELGKEEVEAASGPREAESAQEITIRG